MLFTDAGAQEVNGKQRPCLYACMNQHGEKSVKNMQSHTSKTRYDRDLNNCACLQSDQGPTTSDT